MSLFLVWSNILLHILYMCYNFYCNNTVLYLNPSKYSAYLLPPTHYIYKRSNIIVPLNGSDSAAWEKNSGNLQNKQAEHELQS